MILSFILTVITSVNSHNGVNNKIKNPASFLTGTTWKVADDGVEPQTTDLELSTSASVYIALCDPSLYTLQSDGVLKYTVFLSSLSKEVSLTGRWEISPDYKTLTLKKRDESILLTYDIIGTNRSFFKLKRKCSKTELQTSSDVSVNITFVPL
jgi:hypothetical protein